MKGLSLNARILSKRGWRQQETEAESILVKKQNQKKFIMLLTYP